MDVLLAVLVAAVVAKPDIVSTFHELEGQAALTVSEADPDFAVHHEPMMHVHDLLLEPIFPWPGVDALSLFATLPAQTVQSQ